MQDTKFYLSEGSKITSDDSAGRAMVVNCTLLYSIELISNTREKHMLINELFLTC